MMYAGFWKRFWAMILDGLILVIPLLALNWALPYVGSIVVTLLYYPVFESSAFQATPGKFLLGLRVVDEDGGRLSFPRALARFFLKYVSSVILLLGYLMQLVTAKRQTLHDMITGAVVIQVSEAEKTKGPDWFNVWMKQMRFILRVDEAAPIVDGAPPSSKRTTGNNTSEAAVSAIEKLHELYKNGALTEEEFQSKKSELLKQV